MRLLSKLKCTPLFMPTRSFYGRILAKHDSFQFISAETRHLDPIVKFLGEYHYRQVPTISCFPNVDYVKMAERLRDDTYNQIKDGLSFFVEEKISGEMVGVGLFYNLRISMKDHFAYLADKFKRCNSYHHWKLAENLYEGLDIREEYGSRCIVRARLYSLKPRFQRLGLGNTFLTPTNLVRLPGFQEVQKSKSLFCGEANGETANKILELCGYEDIKRINYSDFEIDGKHPFINLAETTANKFITVRVALMDPSDSK